MLPRTVAAPGASGPLASMPGHDWRELTYGDHQQTLRAPGLTTRTAADNRAAADNTPATAGQALRNGLPGVLGEALDPGGPGRVLEFIDLFLESSGALVEAATGALRRGDLSAAAERSHTLRGNASAFDEEAVVTAAAETERAAGSGASSERAAQMGAGLETTFAAARARLLEVRRHVAAATARP